MLLELIRYTDTYISIRIFWFSIPRTQHLSNLWSCRPCLDLAFPGAPKVLVVIQIWPAINVWPCLDPITWAHLSGIRAILAWPFWIHEAMLNLAIKKNSHDQQISVSNTCRNQQNLRHLKLSQHTGVQKNNTRLTKNTKPRASNISHQGRP